MTTEKKVDTRPVLRNDLADWLLGEAIGLAADTSIFLADLHDLLGKGDVKHEELVKRLDDYHAIVHDADLDANIMDAMTNGQITSRAKALHRGLASQARR